MPSTPNYIQEVPKRASVQACENFTELMYSKGGLLVFNIRDKNNAVRRRPVNGPIVRIRVCMDACFCL